MPLVTLTCSKSYYPVDDESVEPVNHAKLVVDLAQALPWLLSSNQDRLGIGQIPDEAVQVDIHKFHFAAVNTPDLWILMEFTENPDDKETRIHIRDVLLDIIGKWMFDTAGFSLDWALDVFFGPSVGAIVDFEGKTVIDWAE